MGERGSKRLTDRDWLFGARPRRLVLETLLLHEPWKAEWTVDALCGLCEVGPRGLDAHLRTLERLGLVSRERGRVAVCQPIPPLGADLKALLTRLRALPDVVTSEASPPSDKRLPPDSSDRRRD
jgi:DNA-binding HxlR family transcriptional regulator